MHAGILKSCLLFCLVAGVCSVNAQSFSPSGAIGIIARVDSFNKQLPAEKLFIHFDKPYYAIGDTIWFKSYLFQATTNAWSPLSGLLYVDLINDSSRQVRQMSFPVNYGVSWGQIPLTGDNLPEGNYTIRAYSRWLENFGEDYYFSRHFILAPATIQRFTALQALPGGKGRAAASATSVYSAKTDLQFMPESGWLVAGISSRVGFKAIGENGLGVDVQGSVVDKEDNVIVKFHSIHKGMGVFNLLPAAGVSYSAIIRLPGGETVRYPLPSVKKSGIVLRLDNKQESDSIRFSILLSEDLINNLTYHLLGLSRGVACYGANFTLNKKEISGIVAKNAFPSGVAHFTLFNESGEPVNERITFIDHGDNLHIELKSIASVYHTRDSIPVQIQVSDALGQPAGGTFSMAVTDDAQVRADTIHMENIVTRILLTSDLKGFVEEPGWYFGGSDLRYAALDALLLTQGWMGYEWQHIIRQTAAPLFAPEPAMMVSGKVTDLLNLPAKGANVVLMATGKTQFVMDTLTDREGRFVFTSFPPLDSAGFIVQARNAKGKSFGMGVIIDEFKAPALPRHASRTPALRDEQDDSTLLQYVKNNEAMMKVRSPFGGANMLTPVTVSRQKGIKGSQNLNGPGEADQVVDEAMIEKAGKLSLKQLLLTTVKGFRTFYTPDGTEQYKLLQYDTRIVIDGVNLSRFGSVRETLEFLNAEDIVGIEVMYNPRHSTSYMSTFLSPKQQMSIKKEYSFIEITSRSGSGMFMKRTPGLTTYKPLPVTWPRAFYSPRYLVKSDRQKDPDFRSTIHWAPNMLTNHQGQAETSFYSADTPSTYTIIIQGSDMNGNIGVTFKRITITE